MATDSAPSLRGHLPPDHVVGGQLRTARAGQGLSLRMLARAVGISPSALSQIETGRSKPSVGTLYALVTELGLSLDELFSDPGGTDARGAPADPHRPRPLGGQGVQLGASRERITMQSGVVWERLTPTKERHVDFLQVIYDVGGASSRPGNLMRHAGREYGLVLEGHLRVTIGSDEHDLGPGDSIAFESSTPHRLQNVGDCPVHAVWFALGR